MKSIPYFIITLITLNACAVPQMTPTAYPETPPAQAPSESLPYPEPSINDRLNQLEQHSTQLEHQIKELHNRLKQLEQRHTPKPKRNNTQTVAHSTPQTPQPNNPTTTNLNEAKRQYQAGKYQNAVNLLRSADNGGDGSEAAQQSMYLLLQSHSKLGNCQSVINIGQRYAANYTQNPQAAEALYAVGQCQWQIQQRDIARETWQRLMRHYPNSSAAKRATEQLKK